MLISSVIKKELRGIKVLTQKNIKITFLVVLLIKLFALNDRFRKPIILSSGENAAYEFIKAILKEYEDCKKVMKKHFKKN